MKKYLIIMTLKETNEIVYDILDEKEYEVLLDKQTQQEQQDYILELEEKSDSLTYYELSLLIQSINREKIQIIGTYTMEWE